MKYVIAALIFGSMAFLAVPDAYANTVLFTWSAVDSTNSFPLQGSVTFGTTTSSTVNGACSLSAPCLTIDMIAEMPSGNTNAANSNTDMLGGLYFDIQEGTTKETGGTSPGALAFVTADAVDGLLNATGRTVTAGTVGANICAPGGGTEDVSPVSGSACTVSGGWQSAYNASGLGGGASMKQLWAIGTTGQGGVFNGSAVGSFNYTIVPNTGVGSKETKYPFVYTEAYFVLAGLDSTSIYVYNVASGYGTAPDYVPPATLISGEAPEPGNVVIMLVGAALLLCARRRRRGLVLPFGATDHAVSACSTFAAPVGRNCDGR